ncbi:PREDICTED: probable multidrug resistance-associated protein lethal(2)03659 [Acromyrmex echinatior]|uniref:probable multidrug resistance-associated protein lethal(2)03659 n=1 Tax=Acromyrmex echinatior TaxID=103372 RepID=UPI000580DD17|nr:PREDICTED: probable multidrug resistance-associated protein lethal(2)03659 [Acromyrmex echinatior]
MSELIAGIQVVKMYAWEKPFSQIVSVIRKLEIKQIKFSSYVRAAYLAIIVFTERLTVYFTLITFVLMGNNLTADVTYEMSTYFNILQLVVASYFPQGLILLGESIVSFNRLEDFLLMDEVNTRRFSENTPQLQFKFQKSKEESNAENQIDSYISRNGSIVLSEHQRLSDLPIYLQFKSQKPKEATNADNQIDRYISRNESIVLSEHQRLSNLPVYVKLQRVSASDQLPPILCNINLTIKPGQLCAVVGAVGSGKSSILHLLLKELNPGTGSIIFTQGSSKYNFSDNLSTGYFTNNPNLRISYASQEPWLFGGTVRDNVLFGQSYDKARYMQHSDIDDSDYVENIPEAEMTAHGRVAGRVYKEYLHNGDNNFILFVLLMIFIISQVATTGNDYWLSYWTTLENVRRIENTRDVKQFEHVQR